MMKNTSCSPRYSYIYSSLFFANLDKIVQICKDKKGAPEDFEDFEEKETLGNRIDELRLDRELSYTALGKLLGVSRQTAANYCSGKTTTIPKDKLEQLCIIFNVSPAYLLSESNIRSENFLINASCKFTGLSEEAAIKLSASNVTSDALNYLLENTEEEFWTNLLGFFAYEC